MSAQEKSVSITNVTYAGYFMSEVPSEDPELTHVGPGTPCGEYLRKFGLLSQTSLSHRTT